MSLARGGAPQCPSPPAHGDVDFPAGRRPVAVARWQLRRLHHSGWPEGPIQQQPLGTGCGGSPTRTHDKWPHWSPDGRYVVYTRLANGRPSVRVISPLGGPEHMVADGAIGLMDAQRTIVMVTRVGPERREALVHHRLDTGARRELTSAPAFPTLLHVCRRTAREWAFQTHGAGRSRMFVVPLGGGEPQLVERLGQRGDRRPRMAAILHVRRETSGRYFVRTTPDALHPAPVIGVPFNSSGPTLPRLRKRPTLLGLRNRQVDVGLRLIDLARRRTALRHGAPPSPTPPAWTHQDDLSRRRRGGVCLRPWRHAAGLGVGARWLGASQRDAFRQRDRERRLLVAGWPMGRV